MTTTAAAQLLDLPPDATPEQLEARFLELRRRLEEKIAKAPTPGLQAKYRASLAEITTAFETLVLAADSSLLPVLSRDDSVSTAPEVGAKPRGPAAVSPTAAPAPSRQEAKRSARPKKKGNGEFIVVTLVALVVLAAGGWWVMKTRAEKAEQTRLAAEAAAEAKSAELKRQQDAAAEADRITKLATQLRTQLAEARVTWEAYESDLRDAERRASELRSEVRGFRDGPPERKAELSALAARQDLFAQWLKAYLVRHPSKVARARAEQLLEAKAVDEAVAAVDELKAELARIEPEVKERRDYLINASARVVVLSSPLGLPYRYTDAYGRVFEGTTPGEIKGTPLTHVYDLSRDDPTLLQAGEFVAEVAQARFFRPGWPEQTAEMRLTAEDQYVLRADFPQGSFEVESQPSGVPFEAWNDLGWVVRGTTPALLNEAPPGQVHVKLSRSGYKDVAGVVAVEVDRHAAIKLDQRPQHVRITVAEPEAEIWVDGKRIGKNEVTLTDHAPGTHQLELRHPKFSRYRTDFIVKQEFTLAKLAYSFAQLSALKHNCPDCSSRGYHESSQQCGDCSGRGTFRCTPCKGNGYITWEMLGNVRCSYCKGTGREDCYSCSGSGKLHSSWSCSRCNGTGKLSTLQVNQ